MCLQLLTANIKNNLIKIIRAAFVTICNLEHLSYNGHIDQKIINSINKISYAYVFLTNMNMFYIMTTGGVLAIDNSTISYITGFLMA